MNNFNSIYTDAEIYDILFGDYESAEGLILYEELINRYGQPVLELACGSGRITIPLLEKKYDVWGIDLSTSMINLAKFKSKNNIDRFVVGDMREFKIDKEFNFMYMPAQSFQHLLTKEDVDRCLNSVKAHLSKEGAFLIQVFNPGFHILMQDPNKQIPITNEYSIDKKTGDKYFATMQIDYDNANQLLRTKYEYHSEKNRSGSFSLVMRQFFPKELDAIVEYNGFEIIEKFSDNKHTPFYENPKYQNLLIRIRR